MKRTPLTFEQFANEYLVKHTTGKAATTLKVEESVVNRLVQEFGVKRLSSITAADVNAFRHQRLSETSGRTVNLNTSVLSVMFKVARTLGYVDRLPTEDIKPIRYQAARRPLLTPADIEAVCAAAQMHCANGQQLSDFVKFLAFTGARSAEALVATWNNYQISDRVMAFTCTKNRGVRDVDLSAAAVAHLEDMRQRASGERLFSASYAQLYRDLKVAAEKSGRTQFNGFHILRHFFISRCIMAGIDTMTIGKWVGHQDGGVLIGKVYGHLDNAYTKAQAAKLNL